MVHSDLEDKVWTNYHMERGTCIHTGRGGGGGADVGDEEVIYSY